MKRALLVTESSVYRDYDGGLVAHGGGEMLFHNLGKSLLEIGIESTVFAIHEFPGQKSEEIIDGVLYTRFPVYSKDSFRIWRYLKAAIKKSKTYDYIFLNQFTPHLTLPWLRGRKISIIHDVYQKRGWGFWSGQFGFFVGGIGNLIEKLQLRFDLKYSDKIWTVSESTEEKVKDFMGARVAGRLVRASYPAAVSKGGLVEKENMMLFVGRFIDYKNPEHVLYCLKKVRERFANFRAVLVAPRVSVKVYEKFRSLLKQFAFTEMDVEIKFNLSTEELDSLYARAKLLVQPSYVEGQGIVVLEALTHGVPVVAYNLAAYKGMIIDRFNGLLAELGDMEDLTLKCLDILENHQFYRENALKLLPDFSHERFIEKLREVCA